MYRHFAWNKEKNEQLKRERGVSFEEILDDINNRLVRVQRNKSINHPFQKVFVVKHNNYIYLVPYVKEGETVFLKTIIPSRKETKIYYKKLNEENI